MGKGAGEVMSKGVGNTTDEVTDEVAGETARRDSKSSCSVVSTGGRPVYLRRLALKS